MANLPQSSQSDSMDSLTVTREQFRLAKKDELEYLAQALGNVSGTYTTETINPNAVTLQGTPTLASGAEPAAADSSLRLVNTRWVKQNAASTGTTAPTSPIRGQIWIDTSVDPPQMKIWDDTPPPGAWVDAGGGGGASVEIGSTPPTTPKAGDMWWNSDDGRLYIYYTDADSSQWVDASPDSVAPPDLWSRIGTTISPKTAGDSLDMGSFNVDGSAPADSVNLDAQGRLGVGTSTPDRIFHVAGAASFPARLESSGPNVLLDFKTSGNTALSTACGAVGDAFVVNTNSLERMRLTSAGSLLINATAVGGGSGLLHIGFTPTTNSAITTTDTSTTAGAKHQRFFSGASEVGYISTTAGATTYSTSSDYRLKENVVPLTGAAARVQQLKPSKFNFIADPGTTVDGFIAHEAQAVVPECVVGTKDEVDADGNPVYQGIDQSKLVPLLTAALQEALAKIETLETKVAALEGGAH